ncbi:ubiquinone/menaquinone biosynthesis methyltransferase [Bacteroidales bacterium OttesenSCG-928-I21]|nr:ubiquinone/menaquinone biosynthesis methyltransferase [Bacteroidales bacterium OttesenSCG-928-I21]
MAKKESVKNIFDNIAPSYDKLNHLLSLNIDKRWRRLAIKTLSGKKVEKLLDVACGTGDFSVAAAESGIPYITGVDISEKMIEVGQEKIKSKNLADKITLQYGDSEQLDFSDKIFDAVTVAFGVRNFENLEVGLKEMCRVLKDDGKIVILEFSIPEYFPVKQLYLFYFNKILQQSSSGDKNMPLTLSVYGAVTATSKKLSGADFGDRLGTVLQMLVTREFYDKFTLQMAPIWVYNARKFTSDDSRHIFSVGLGAHVKIKERMSVNLEYYPLFDNMKFAGTSSPLSLGFNLQTHGHIFQVFIGNSMAPNEHLLFLHTKDKWKDGNIHIGFNLIRSFNIGKAL